MENAVLVYFVKESVALAFFFLLYLFLFRSDTIFVVKRIYMLFGMGFSAVFPFLTIHLPSNDSPRLPAYWLSDVVVVPFAKSSQASINSVDWPLVLVGVLMVVSFTLFVRFVLQLMEVLRLKYSHVSRREGKFTLVKISELNISPFSFFRWIFVGSDLWNSDSENEILLHERVHVLQWHSADVVFSELFCAFFWWNPIAWFFRREIRVNHEYLADRAVLSVGRDPKQYQYLLLETLVLTNRIPINNYFNISQLKQRIAMMNKKQSPKPAAAKYLLVFPLAALLIVGNAVQASSLRLLNNMADKTADKEIPQDQNQPKKGAGLDEIKVVGYRNDASSDVQDRKTSLQSQSKSGQTQGSKVTTVIEGEQVFTAVEEMPRYPGGEKALMQYLSRSISYPEISSKQGIQGRVVVRFVVGKKGDITDIDIIRGVDPSLDKEAVRVIKSMPKWTPGKQNGKAVPVYYVLPIVFALPDKEKSAGGRVEIKEQDASALNGMPTNLLYIVDGNQQSADDVKKIHPDQIESISVLKDKSAIDSYGDLVKGKEGVIVIRLKK
jgi:TonB family protein